MTRKFRIGRVVWQSVVLTFKNLLPLSVLAGLCSLPLLLLMINTGPGQDPTHIAMAEAGAFSLLVQIVFGALTQVVLINAVVSIAQGHRADVVRCLRLGLFGSRPALITALVLATATQASMNANALLGLVISIFVMALFFIAVPIAVAERKDAMSALGRSVSLTKGVRLRIVGLLFVLIMLVMGLGILMAIAGIEETGAGLSATTLFVIQILTASLGASISVLAYDEIRQIKEDKALYTIVAARIA